MRQFMHAIHRGHAVVRLALVVTILSAILPASAGLAQPTAMTAPGLPETARIPSMPPTPRIPPPNFVPPPLRPVPPASRPAPPPQSGVVPNAQPGLPLAFRPTTSNSSLADRFTSEGPGWRADFTAAQVVLSLAAETPAARTFGKGARFQRPHIPPGGPPKPDTIITIAFAQAKTRDRLQGVGRLPARARVFQRTPLSEQAAKAPMFDRVRYRALYPGITLTYQNARGNLQSVYHVAPGADPTQIRWRYNGVGPVTIDSATGDLHLHAVGDPKQVLLTEHHPVAWQATRERRMPVGVRYQIGADGWVSFVVDTYDPTLPLIIDPVLTYSTYVGGTDEEQGDAIAVDSSGNLYVAFTTTSTDFPTTNPLYGPSSGPCANYWDWCHDIVIAKFSPDGQTLLAATYLGGTGDDFATDLAVGVDGRVYVLGTTDSTDFPLANALQSTLQTTWPYDTDAVLVVLENDLSALDYATYLGGSGSDTGESLAVDATGAAYLTGRTDAADFPVTTGAYDTTCGNDGTCGDTLNAYIADDAYVAKVSADGSALMYATYVGGDEYDLGYAITVDSVGDAYIAGITDSDDFPLVNAPQSGGGLSGDDAFVTHLSADGSTLEASTYLGGSEYEVIGGIAVDATGQVVVTGGTYSTDFPRTNAYQATCDVYVSESSAADAFVTGYTADGAAVRFSTCVGGQNHDISTDVALDASGNVYLTGITDSADFPLVQPEQRLLNQTVYPAYSYFLESDAFVAAFEPSGQNLFYNTYYGSTRYDYGLGLTTTLSGTVSMVGNVEPLGTSTVDDLPLVQPYQGQYAGGYTDAFIAQFGPPIAMPQDQGYCPVCGAAAAPQPTTPYPVSTRSGNFSTSVTDLSVGTPGPTVSWSRTYVSQGIDAIDVGFGAGWHHPYAMNLVLPAMPGGEADRVILRASNGNRERFAALGSGQYDAFPGVHGTLVESGGSFTLTQRDQSVLTFDSTTGLLQRLSNPQGEAVELIYTSGTLTQVRDAVDTQRALTLTYDVTDPSLIASVSDGTRTVNYSYTNGDLTQVLDVMNRPTSYVYQSHLLTEMEDALGGTVEAMTYDVYSSAGKVISQTLQDGRQFAFEYLPETTVITTTGPGGALDVMHYDYSAGNVLNGMTRNDQALSTTIFDPSLSPGTVVDANGNTTEATYTETGLPLSRSDALGQTTQTVYDSLNRPTIITDTRGRRTELAYDSANNVTSQTTDITGTFTGFTTLFTYDVRYPGEHWLEDTVGPDGVQTRYEYDSDGQRTAVTINYEDGVYDQNAPDQDLRTTYNYDALGRVVTTTVGFGTALQRADVTDYNLDGTVARTIQNYDDGASDPQHPDQDIITAYGYDDLGRQVWVKNALGRYDATHYDTAGRTDWAIQNLAPFQVDTDGLPVFQAFDRTAPDANVATLYAYDGLGRTTLVTQTGLLDGSFDPLTRTFSGETTRTTFTQYDTQSRPITVTLNYQPSVSAGPDINVQTVSQYDAVGNVIGQRDALGRWTYTQYDALNRPITVTLNYENGDPLTVDSANISWATITDTDLIQVTIYLPDGRVDYIITDYVDGVFDTNEPDRDHKTVYVYDDVGRQTQTIYNYVDGDPNTGTAETDQMTETVYDAAGRTQATRDLLGQYASLIYDAARRVTTTIQNCRDGGGTPIASGCDGFASNVPDRNVPTETRFDALGRGFETVNALGIVTRLGYDGVGRLVATTQNYVSSGPINSDTNVTTTQVYDALGRTTIMTDAVGATSSQMYNALGYTTVMTDAVGRTSFAGYDGLGTARWQETSDGRFIVQQFDGLGRTITATVNYDDGVVGGSESIDQDVTTRTVYDVAGRPVATIDATGRETRFTYDLRDNLLSVTENATDTTCMRMPCNVVTTYAYDRASNRVSVTDANNHTLTFTFDTIGRQVTETDALSQTTSYVYDRPGRLTFKDDPRGVDYDVTYTYDELARPTGMNATELDSSIEMTYNALGWRTGLTDGTGSTAFSYDELGRITQVSEPSIGDLLYHYNARGERIGLSYPSTPNGTEVGYAYTADGQLAAVQQGRRTLASYRYDDAGRVAAVTRDNGAITAYGYDGADRLATLHTYTGATTRSHFAYTLDRNGQRTAIQETIPTAHEPGTGLVGYYFSDSDFETQEFARRDATVDFDWGTGSPDASIPADAFAIFWAGELEAPVAGEYTFVVTTDDGVSLSVGEELLINESSAVGAGVYTATMTLEPGQRYELYLDYTEQSGPAQIELAWIPPGQAQEVIGQEWLYASTVFGVPAATALVGSAAGLRGDYYLGRQFEQPTLNRIDETVDFVWDNGSPDTALSDDNFSVIWHGQLEAPLSATYYFIPNTDDGVQLWVGGQLLVDQWKSQGPTESYATITLKAGERYDIELAYYEGGGGATAQLSWLVPGQIAKEIIPEAYLYPADTTPPAIAPGTAIEVSPPTALGAPTRTITYTYDGLVRLTEAEEAPGITYAYSYDLAGNRTEAWENSVQVQSRSYNAANQVTGWSYDAAGNLLSNGSSTATYDALSRLTSQEGAGYRYNGDGVLMVQSTGVITTNYTQDLVSPLSQVLGDGSTTYLYGHERLVGQASGTTTWYSYDGLGSLRQTLDAAGVPLARTSYDPWGVPQADLVASFGFTGELQDTEGQVYLRARWYTANNGSFQSRDSYAGLPTKPYSLHPYQYGYSNPLNYVDPTGELAIFVGGYKAEEATNIQDVGIWALAVSVHNEGLVDGSVIIAEHQAFEKIEREVMRVALNCSKEPIILVGHSLGGRAIMAVARRLYGRAYPAAPPKIDLMITLDPAILSTDFGGDPTFTSTPSNVKTHVNLLADQRFRVTIGPGIPLARQVGPIQGADNRVIAGSKHTTIDNEFLDEERKISNEAWMIIKSEIQRVSQDSSS